MGDLASSATLLLIVGLLVMAAGVALYLFVDQRRRTARRRTTQQALTLLNRFGQAILQAGTDEEALVDAFFHYASALFPHAAFEMVLFDAAGAVEQVLLPPDRSDSLIVPYLDPLKGLMQQPRTLLLPTLDEGTLAAERSRQGAAVDPFGRLLVMPLLANERLLGFCLARSEPKQPFNHNDGRILSILATQAAGAFQNARSYHQERWRGRQLQTLAQVSRMIAEVPNLDEFLRAVVELVRENFGYYHVQIYMVEEDGRHVVYRAGSGDAGRALAQLQLRQRIGHEGIISWVVEQSQPLLVNDVAHEPRYLPEPRHILPHTCAEMAVPLKIEERVLGALDVQSDVEGGLDEEDLFTVSALADQIAIAIEDAGLALAQREEAWVTRGMLELAEAVNPLFELDDVLATLTDRIPTLLNVDAAAIYLWDPLLEQYAGASSSGLPEPAAEQFNVLKLPADQFPLLDTIRRQGELMALETAYSQELVPSQVVDLLGEIALVGTPLASQGDFVGVLLLGWQGALRPLSERRRRLVEGITQIAASSIQAALLYASQQDEAAISRELLSLAELLATTTDLTHALGGVAQITNRLAEVERTLIYLWNERDQQLVPAASSGLRPEQHWLWWDQPIDLTSHQLDALQQSEEPLLLGTQQPVAVPPMVAALFQGGSAIAVPMRTAESFVGALFVERRNARPQLSARRRAVLLGVSRQLSIALEHDRLLAEALENARRTQELAFARRIQAALLPDRAPKMDDYEVAGYWRPAREVAGDFYDYLELDGGRWAFSIADVADKGLGAALFMVLTRTALRESLWQTEAAGPALNRTNRVISRDVQGGMFLTLLLLILDTTSGTLQMANAGHIPPIVYRAESESLSMPSVRNMPMAILADTHYDQSRMQIAAGDLIVMVTDGITEVADPDGRLFGSQQLADVIYRHRDEMPRQLISEILDAVIDHASGRAFDDDITVVVVRRKSPV
ncbi:MAG: SpoIIE family protein phosphatase [Anaerolineales bacterium]|nr:SpoIIE family protein phosphatase [Anaerolineales bacterium]MCB9127750.1 SpoIIE family protein phosphatase [Ardenticatenales bacterium]